MARQHEEREEVELKHRAFEYRVAAARQVFELVRDIVLLLVAVALAATAIICALRGYQWPISAGTGGFSILAATAPAIGSHLKR
jgi:F0F1-type ATP synthase assembly protein I